MALTLDGTNGVTFNDTSLQGAAASPNVLKNRIINGAMVIDQRNAGASVTPTNGQYLVDRFNYVTTQTSKVTAIQSSTAPTGFTKSLLFTSSSSYAALAGDLIVFAQAIEGFNTADLAWGTASAKTITLSFQVYSSLTGTFGGCLRNDAGNRFYVFSYSIPAANTWTTISITVAGDTTGTWATDTSAGIRLYFNLGCGTTYSGTAGSWGSTAFYNATGSVNLVATNGATFYITGVQLEVGSSATPFERRLYGQELISCQRYFEKSYELVTVPSANTVMGVVHVSAASNGYADMLTLLKFNVQKRTTPTMTFYREDGTSGSWNMERSGSSTTPTVNSAAVGDNGGRIYCATGANWTVASIKGHWTSSAEL